MLNADTTNQATIPPAHEDFHWIFGPRREERFADFIELTRDISAGICSCMQIIYTSDLVREENQDVEPDHQIVPSIGKIEAARLFRLSMAAAALLCGASEERIDSLNKFLDK